MAVIFSTHSVVRIYDIPELFIRFNYLYDKGVSYFLHILWLEYMIPPTIYTISGCHVFYAFCG